MNNLNFLIDSFMLDGFTAIVASVVIGVIIGIVLVELSNIFKKKEVKE